ncbi:Stage III sporulation protein AE precursor [compost metagenome]
MIICVFFLSLWSGGVLEASPSDSAVNEWVRSQAESLPKDEVERYWDQLMNQYGGFFPQQHTPSFMDMLLPGKEKLTLEGALSALGAFLWQEIALNAKLLVTIVMLSIMSMVLETLQTAFERNQVSKIAYSLCYMVIVIIAINSFTVAIQYAKSAIGMMTDFMLAMLPLLFTLLASMGNVITVSVTHPLIVFMIHTIANVIHMIVFPLFFFSALLYLVSSLTDKYKLTQLASLLRTIGAGLLGGLLTVFLGVISVQGWTSSVTDGMTLRTAKFITGSFVPVVGKALADATDTVITASLLVKNAIGLAGVIIILFLCAFPAIKILTLALIYSVTAAIMQPLGNTPIVSCLQSIGKGMMHVFAAVAAVGLMCFLAITIMLTAGNLTVMMR